MGSWIGLRILETDTSTYITFLNQLSWCEFKHVAWLGMIGIVNLNKACVSPASDFAQRDPVVFPQLEVPCLDEVLQIPGDRPAALIGCIESGRRHQLSGWCQSNGTGFLNPPKTRTIPQLQASSFVSKMLFTTNLSLSLYLDAWQLMRHTLYHPWKPWHRRPLVCISRIVKRYCTWAHIEILGGSNFKFCCYWINMFYHVCTFPSWVILGSSCSGTRWAWFVKKTGLNWMRGRPTACYPSSKWRPIRTWVRWILGWI